MITTDRTGLKVKRIRERTVPLYTHPPKDWVRGLRRQGLRGGWSPAEWHRGIIKGRRDWKRMLRREEVYRQRERRLELAFRRDWARATRARYTEARPPAA